MVIRLWMLPSLILLVPLVLGLAKSETLAQTGDAIGEQRDEIPPAALLTDRGTALVERLKQLRRTESRMGAKHPSLPEVREQIDAILRELKAWQPAPNPFRSSTREDAASPELKPIPLMNEEDLRQIVLALTQEVSDLRRRVEALEEQQPSGGR